jgi:hypothetical protein
MRMWGAAALCVVPLGLLRPAVGRAPIRVLLVVAASGFVLAATRRCQLTLRVARGATCAAGGSLALALSARQSAVTLLLVGAVMLCTPAVRRGVRGGLAPPGTACVD